MNGCIAGHKGTRRAKLRTIAHTLKRFTSDQSGAMLVLGIFFLTVMLMMGGLALDLMRYESTRTRLQQTSDRAVLAAASLKQKLDAKTVVRDYFAKAGLSDKITDVDAVRTFNAKTVWVDASATVTPFFMQMMGIKELKAPAYSQAIEKISDVEIVLVLDVSGSMGDPAGGGISKITALKNAAYEFVDMVLADDVEDRISISIVPYNMKVNVGPYLFPLYPGLKDKLNDIDLPEIKDFNCIDLQPENFASLGAMKPGTVAAPVAKFPQTGWFDDSSSAGTNGWQTMQPTSESVARSDCQGTQNIVRPPTNDIVQLKADIKALTAGGNTSIDQGMRWGTALLDPGTRPIISKLITSKKVPAYFDGRPYDYDRDDTLKVVVLMTDGEHTEETALNSGYRNEDMSPIYRNNGDGNWSIYYKDRLGSKYYVPHLGTWQAGPYKKSATNTTTQMKWREVWRAARMKWVAYQFYTRPMGNSVNSMITAFRTTKVNSTADMDTRLQSVCTAAKNEEVVVFGIAFKAPSNGRSQISKCASSAGHYYNAEDKDEIATAFRSIATQISRLRLTQ